MRHLIQRGFIVSLLVLVMLFSVSAADEFSAQRGFDWLADQAASDGSYGSDVSQTALAVLALDSVGYGTSSSQEWLASQLSSDFCYPSSACTVQGTSFAVLALNQVQDDGNFDDIAAWYADALSEGTVSGNWYIEVSTSATGTCVVSYDLNDVLQEVDVAVDQGFFPDCGNSHFLDLDSCLQAGLISAHPGILLDVDCGALDDPDTVLTLLYQSSSTYYLLANENAQTAEFQVNNGCFGKSSGGSCDLLSSLYASWALDLLGSPLPDLVYLKENYDASDPTQVALLYLSTKDTSYLDILSGLQKSDGSFDRDSYTTALAILALQDSPDSLQAVDDARLYLEGEQSANGDWGGSVETTAFVLYAAFQGEDVSPGLVSPGEGQNPAPECTTGADCVLLYGSGYSCDSGDCVLASTEGCSIDDDCDGKVCLDEVCVKSDCNYDGKCEYPAYDENAYNCPSDCSCGDGKCDNVESSSASDFSCPADCGGAAGGTEPECVGDSDCSSGETCNSSGSCVVVPPTESNFTLYLILLFIVILFGVGGYFAYKKGLFGHLFSRFKKGGGKGSQTGVGGQEVYTPFSSRLPPQQQGPFGGSSQPRRPY